MIFWNGWFPFLFTNQVENKAAAEQGPNSDANRRRDQGLSRPSPSSAARSTSRRCCAPPATRATRSPGRSSDRGDRPRTGSCIHHVPPRDEDDDDRNTARNGLAWYQQGYYRLLAHTPGPARQGAARTTARRSTTSSSRERVKDLIHEIELWRKSKDWYLEKGIPWKRGWLLYGPPGTGKTALARAFAEDLNMPIYVYNLAEMGNHELIKAWTEMQINMPCIALIEDIDNVFHGRENVVRAAGHVPDDDAAEKKDGDDEQRQAAAARSAAADVRLPAELPRRRRAGRRDLHHHHDQRPDQDRPGPGPAAEAAGRDDRVHLARGPGRIDKAVELTYMEPADKKRMAQRDPRRVPETEYLEMLEFIDQFPDLPGDAGAVPGAVRAGGAEVLLERDARGRPDRDGPDAARDRPGREGGRGDGRGRRLSCR